MGISLASSSRGQLPPPTLSSTSCGAHALICCRGHRPLVVCTLPHTLSSTSRGAHALFCSRGHRPLVVCTLTHSLIYQLWCSCAHLQSWASSSRGLHPHTLSHLPAVVLMCSSAVVDIVLSWSAPSHTLSHLPAVVLMRSSAVVGIVLSWSAPSPTLFLIYQQWCSCAHLLS